MEKVSVEKQLKMSMKIQRRKPQCKPWTLIIMTPQHRVVGCVTDIGSGGDTDERLCMYGGQGTMRNPGTFFSILLSN